MKSKFLNVLSDFIPIQRWVKPKVEVGQCWVNYINGFSSFKNPFEPDYLVHEVLEVKGDYVKYIYYNRKNGKDDDGINCGGSELISKFLNFSMLEKEI